MVLIRLFDPVALEEPTFRLGDGVLGQRLREVCLDFGVGCHDRMGLVGLDERVHDLLELDDQPVA